MLTAACGGPAGSDPLPTATAPSLAPPTVTAEPTARPTATAVPPSSPTPAPAPTVDVVAAVMAAGQSRDHGVYPAPDGLWQAEILIYDCVSLGAEGEVAYEQLLLTSVQTGAAATVADQVQYCGGLGAGGLDGLFWSANSRYFYYTNAREGFPDGCGYWARPLLRIDVTDGSSTYLGGGILSPDRTKLAAWQEREVVVWEAGGGELGRTPALVASADRGAIVWAPDSQSFLYFQVETYCPLAGASYVVRLDLPDLQPVLLLESDAPTFSGAVWDAATLIRMFDENGAPWTYDLVTGELKAAG